MPGWLKDTVRKATPIPKLVLYKLNPRPTNSAGRYPDLGAVRRLLFLFDRRFQLYGPAIFVTYSLASLCFC